MLSKPSWGKKKGSTPFQLPSDDIEGWLRKVNSSSAGQRAVEQKAGRNISAGSWSAGHPAKRPSTLDHSGTQEKRKRHDMPVVRKIDRAAMATAQEKISTGAGRRDALDALVNDFYASSSQAPRTSQLKTWERYHATCMVIRSLFGHCRSRVWSEFRHFSNWEGTSRSRIIFLEQKIITSPWALSGLTNWMPWPENVPGRS